MKRIFSAAAIVAMAAACSQEAADTAVDASPSVAAADSAFRAMDHRHGDMVGANPSDLAHRFVSTPEGGDVILERKAGDSMTVQQIHAHLEAIARAFSTGDFSTPAFIHEGQADGADVMARKAGAITYTVADTGNGSVLRIRTSDPQALEAIHRFIAFQVREHRTDG